MRTAHRSRRSIPPRSAFTGFRFPVDVIVLAVRWYLRFGLSYRDVEELLSERGVEVDHVTVYRWVLRFAPLLAEAARPCRHAIGDRWQVDETYVKVAGQWRYVYRAIDQFGQVIDVFVSTRRNATAAHRFFERAVGTTKVRPAEGTVASGPKVPPAGSRVEPFPVQTAVGSAQSNQFWHHRWRLGALVEVAGLSDRQMQQQCLRPAGRPLHHRRAALPTTRPRAIGT